MYVHVGTSVLCVYLNAHMHIWYMYVHLVFHPLMPKSVN